MPTETNRECPVCHKPLRQYTGIFGSTVYRCRCGYTESGKSETPVGIVTKGRGR